MLPERHPERIEELLYTINTERTRDVTATEVTRWVDMMLREIETQVLRVIGERAHQDYILTHIKREKTKLQQPTDSRKNPYNKDRERPLCTCGLECAIQSADEPAEFKEIDDLDEAIRAFKRSHPGHPIVLDEAREAYYEEVAEVRDILRELVLALMHDEIPDYGNSVAELRASLAENRDGGSDGDGDSDDSTGQSTPDDQIGEVAAARGGGD